MFRFVEIGDVLVHQLVLLMGYQSFLLKQLVDRVFLYVVVVLFHDGQYRHILQVFLGEGLRVYVRPVAVDSHKGMSEGVFITISDVDHLALSDRYVDLVERYDVEIVVGLLIFKLIGVLQRVVVVADHVLVAVDRLHLVPVTVYAVFAEYLGVTCRAVAVLVPVLHIDLYDIERSLQCLDVLRYVGRQEPAYMVFGVFDRRVRVVHVVVDLVGD